MKRKKKKFVWPRKIYDKPRIVEEDRLVERYGLKNKKEIWKVEAKVKYFRTRAKSLITAGQEEQQKFFGKLNKIGLDVKTIADVLALNKENLLRRRLSHIVTIKKLANTPKQARQMITHKKIIVGERIVDVPSYLVEVEEENAISVRVKKIATAKGEKPEVQEVPLND